MEAQDVLLQPEEAKTSAPCVLYCDPSPPSPGRKLTLGIQVNRIQTSWNADHCYVSSLGSLAFLLANVREQGIAS